MTGGSSVLKLELLPKPIIHLSGLGDLDACRLSGGTGGDSRARHQLGMAVEVLALKAAVDRVKVNAAGVGFFTSEIIAKPSVEAFAPNLGVGAFTPNASVGALIPDPSILIGTGKPGLRVRGFILLPAFRIQKVGSMV